MGRKLGLGLHGAQVQGQHKPQQQRPKDRIPLGGWSWHPPSSAWHSDASAGILGKHVELLQAERKGRSHHATLPSCLTAWVLPEAHRGVATLSGVSDMSTPTHPGWTSGGGIHRVPSWGSHAAANPRPAFSEFLDFLIFAPSFNFFPEFRISAWCSLCFFACSLANLQAVVWGPCKASPNYITAWLFQIKESCWHTKI